MLLFHAPIELLYWCHHTIKICLVNNHANAGLLTYSLYGNMDFLSSCCSTSRLLLQKDVNICHMLTFTLPEYWMQWKLCTCVFWLSGWATQVFFGLMLTGALFTLMSVHIHLQPWFQTPIINKRALMALYRSTGLKCTYQRKFMKLLKLVTPGLGQNLTPHSLFEQYWQSYIRHCYAINTKAPGSLLLCSSYKKPSPAMSQFSWH